MTLRFASKNGRSHIVVGPDNGLVDLAEASGGTFSSEPIEAFRRWDEVRAFAASYTGTGTPCDVNELDAPSPWPTQVFGIGLNYRTHAEESGMEIPKSPLTFTKFTSFITNLTCNISISLLILLMIILMIMLPLDDV